jgi:hypothetical protein
MPVFWNDIPFLGRFDVFAERENVFSGAVGRVCEGRWMSVSMRQLCAIVASDGRLKRVLRFERLSAFLPVFVALAPMERAFDTKSC